MLMPSHRLQTKFHKDFIEWLVKRELVEGLLTEIKFCGFVAEAASMALNPNTENVADPSFTQSITDALRVRKAYQ